MCHLILVSLKDTKDLCPLEVKLFPDDRMNGSETGLPPIREIIGRSFVRQEKDPFSMIR